MSRYGLPTGGWNLFARVLQEILALHGIGLGNLDDHPGVHVHKEKVRRLQKSIRENILTFPMLTPDELERVITVYRLNDGEQLRLRAAVLATAIEITLMERIDHYEALTAAEEILPILERVLRANARHTVGIGAIKGGITVTDKPELDAPLERALTALDRATLALTLSRDVQDHWERTEHLRQAESGFERALAQLDGAAQVIKQTASWKLWHEEAYQSLMIIVQQLALLDR
jgi:hypothetical protein